MTYVDTQNIQIQYKVFHQSNVTKGKRSISISLKKLWNPLKYSLFHQV